VNITHIGLLAGAITTAAAIPQVVRTYRTKHARDISIWQPILLNIGMSLWLVYGIALRDVPLIYANSISLVCYTSLIIMKILYRDDDKRSESDIIQSN
jgi:MtN3 and saliva related transmembrane protein